ncbi:MAG: lysophospholipid acyltransferase family protein [Acidobacteria bacterium]|nr:lysophospholipid acyltransferase family protein [Acidobacteriota bacterium]
MTASLESGESIPVSAPEAKLDDNPRTFTLWQRIQILVASWVGYFAVLLIGRTLRWEVYGWENWEAARKIGNGLIYTFWHREILPATWFWRKRGIVVMTSQNFDGEYIARIIQAHGYGAARGSSSRGASRALAEMVRCLESGRDTAFTIDGPRGPRFVAKRGSVLLAKPTGAAILCFHIALKRAYVFEKSWDRFQIPCPFTRAAIFIAPPTTVPQEAGEEEQTRIHQHVQATLDELRGRGEEWAAGTPLRNSKLENRNS